MKAVLAPGTRVLNQDPEHPLIGEIVAPPEGKLEWAGMYYVKWASGLVTEEQAEDLILTGNLNIELR